MSTANNVDLEAFDIELDDLEDLPSNEPFPVGVHLANLSLRAANIDSLGNVVFADFTLIEHKELADEEAEELMAGSTAGVMFNFGNEWGRGDFKKLSKSLREHEAFAGITTVSALIAAVQDVEVLIETSLNKSKNDKVYMSVEQLIVQ